MFLIRKQYVVANYTTQSLESTQLNTTYEKRNAFKRVVTIIHPVTICVRVVFVIAVHVLRQTRKGTFINCHDMHITQSPMMT